MYVINTMQDIRDALNKNVGSFITTKDFSKPVKVSNYLRTILENGYVERVSLGKYKVLKKITLKKKGFPKGTPCANAKWKDLNKLPAILNSSNQGLVLLEIEQAYKKITPVTKQVNRNYLYRFFRFAIKQGVVKHNGVNKLMRISDRGPSPKRLVLINKDITEEEWNQLAENYISWYSGKKQTKSRRKKKQVSGSVGMKSIKIVNSFTQTRKNPNKEFVESHFLTTVKQYIYHGHKIDCLSVTGPDYDRHIEKLFATIANKVCIVERKKGVFKEIFNKASICPNYIAGNVDLIKADLMDVIVPGCQYVDLDLMCSLQGQTRIISRYISTQLHYFLPDTIKFLTFTASIRNDGGPAKRFKVLQDIFLNSGLNALLHGFQGDGEFGDKIPMGNHKHSQLKFCYKHVPIMANPGRIIDTQVFTYQDTTPMLSILFVYK